MRPIQTTRPAVRRWPRLLRAVLVGSLAAAAGMMVQPLHSSMICVALLVALATAWLGLLLLWRRWWHRALWVVPPLIVASALLLPGRGARPNALREAYVEALGQLEGTRYVWGGENRVGIDCSGLVRRALMSAAVDRGARDLNPALLRLAWELWWNDASARALRDGHRGQTRRLAAAPSLNALDHRGLQPGDLAVTADGVHILAYLGQRTWIEANPDLGRVVRLSAPSDSIWFRVRVQLVRWRALEVVRQ